MMEARIKPPWSQVVVAIVISMLTWAAMSLIDHGARLSAQEARMRSVEQWLERVEGKLDRVLERAR